MKIYFTTHKFTLISWLIRKATGANFSHVVIGDITDERPIVLHSTRTGLHYSYIKNVINEDTLIHEFEFIPKNLEKSKKAFYKILNLLESPYDYSAIIGFIYILLLRALGIKRVKNPLGSKGAIFCSETGWILSDKFINIDEFPSDMLDDFEDMDSLSQLDFYNLLLKYPSYFRKIK